MQEWYEHKKASGGDPSKARPYYENPLYIAQHKLDGVRYHIYCDRRGNVKIYSRVTSAITGDPVEKTEVLAHIAREAKDNFRSGFVIDGELVAAKGQRTTFKDVTRISGSLPEKAKRTQEREGFLRFAAFDLLVWNEEEITHVPQEERLEILYRHLPDEDTSSFIYALPCAYGSRDKKLMREEVLKSDGEGLILKHKYGLYNPKRNKDWVKDKFVQHIDVVFMGIQMGRELSVKKGDIEATTTRVAGLAGAIKFGMYIPTTSVNLSNDTDIKFIATENGFFQLKEIGRTSGFDDEMRMDLTMNAEAYKGRVFQVRGQMQYSDTYAIREPRFECWRDDKRPEECIVEAR